MKKKITFSALFVVLCLLTGCASPFWYGKHPADQPGTAWTTEDGKVIFYVDADELLHHGVLQTEDGEVEIVLSMTLLASDIGVSYASDLVGRQGEEPLPEIELWICEKVTKTTFVVSVQKTTYFEEGQELIFYRVDE